MVCPLIACLLTLQGPATPIRFSDGTRVRVSSDRASFSVEGKGAARVDLKDFLRSRIASYSPGATDKTANHLAWESGHGIIAPYLLQLVPVSPFTAIGIVAVSRRHMSQPNDMLHDLVILNAKDPQTLTLVRPLRPLRDNDSGSTPCQPRLFWSQGKLVLRVPGALEILSAKGETTGTLPLKDSETMCGQNSKGELVLADPRAAGFTLYNLKERKSRMFLAPRVDGQQVGSYYGRIIQPGKLDILISANVTVKRGDEEFREGHSFSVQMDVNTGRVLQPLKRIEY